MSQPWEKDPVIDSPWEKDPVVGEKKAQSTAGKIVNQVLDSAHPGRTIAKYAPDVVFGAKQAWDAAAQMLSHAVPEGVRNAIDTAGGGETADQHARRSLAEYEANFNPSERGVGADIVRVVGQTVPLIAATAATGGVAAPAAVANVVSKVPAVLKAVFGGAAAGGSSGVLTPVYEETDQFWTEKAKQGGKGAAVGAATGGVLHGASSVIAPQLAKAQKALADEGVTLMPGQAFGGMAKAVEDKLASVPFIGDLIKQSRFRGIQDFNRAIYSRATKPFGQEGAKVAAEADVGHNGVAKVGDFLSAQYEKALSRSVPSKLDDEFVASISELGTMVPQSKTGDFIRTVQQEIANKVESGHLTPSVAKQIDSRLKAKAAEYTRSADAEQRELGYAFREAASRVRELFAKNNPETAPAIRAADEGWATLVQMERAAGMVGARDGIFTPSQFVSAVKATSGGPRKRQFARGEARNQEFAEAARDVLPDQVPNSGTADRAFMGAAALNMPALLAGLTTPAGAGLALASIPYLPGIGPLVMRAALNRPQGATRLADLVRGSAPTLGAPAGALALQQ